MTFLTHYLHLWQILAHFVFFQLKLKKYKRKCNELKNVRNVIKRVNIIHFKDDDIALIIILLDSKKTYGVDNISIYMITLCGDSIILPPSLIFAGSIFNSVFPDFWKWANVILFHKKESRIILKNTVQSVFWKYLLKYLLKYLKDYYSILCFFIFMITIYLLSVSVTYFTWWLLFITVSFHCTWNSVII